MGDRLANGDFAGEGGDRQRMDGGSRQRMEAVNNAVINLGWRAWILIVGRKEILARLNL